MKRIDCPKHGEVYGYCADCLFFSDESVAMPHCSDCGKPFEEHRKALSNQVKSFCYPPDTRHWYIPAVSEVAR
jgi:hypothetical protein